jgi:hypothetical protein
LLNTGQLGAWQGVSRSPPRRCRRETFKKILVQTVPCQAVALDLRNGRGTVLVLRQMQYENGVRLITREEIEQKMDELAREFAETHDPEIREEIYSLAHQLIKLDH